MATSAHHGVSTYLVVLVAIAALGPLQFGFHLAELNAPQNVITCLAPTQPKSKSVLSRLGLSSFAASSSSEPLPPVDCIPMNAAAFATISSVYTLGALLGALVAGPLSSSRGRLLAMRLTAIAFILGSLVESVAHSVAVMSSGRFLSGCGGGAATVIVPLYISEVAPPAARGIFGAATQISINIGLLGTQTLGFFLSHGSMWRWILGTGAVLGATHSLGLFVVPESPAWLANSRGDVAAARRTLQRIRGSKVQVDDEVLAWGRRIGSAGSIEEDRVGEVQRLLSSSGNVAEVRAPESPRVDTTKKDDKGHLGFLQVAKDPLYRPALVAIVGIMLAQQFCGINSIIMYSVALLADLLPISSSLMAILISVINLAATVACSPLPDKLGRKTCLLISIIGQGSSSLILALSILLHVKILSAIAVLFFVGFFAMGLGPVPFMLASELVDQKAVGATQSWGLATNYVATFIVAQFFPILNQTLNQKLGGAGWVYFIFAASALMFAFFVGFKVPETKGKRNVDEVWGRTRRLD